jgi:hypothetical protein
VPVATFSVAPASSATASAIPHQQTPSLRCFRSRSRREGISNR